MTVTQDRIIDVSESNFQRDVIERSHETAVVVDFWAPWCGPCRMLGPILERLATEPGSDFILAKLNVDHAPTLSMEYGVQGIPAVKAFRDGRVVDEFVGAQPEPQVRQFLRRIAPNPAQQAVGQAQTLLKEQEWAAAETAFRRLIKERPQEAAVKVGLAKALLAQGQGCEAEGLLQNIAETTYFGQAEALRPLASYLCRVANAPQNQELTLLETRYRQAADWLRQDNFTRAMDTILAVLQEKKSYHNDEARLVMLAFFELLDDDPQVPVYRQKLASVLY